MRPIEVGQKISIDPCSFVKSRNIEKALTDPVTAPSRQLTISETGADVDKLNPYCWYEKKGAEGNGEYFRISAAGETKEELNTSGENVTGIGRDAVIRQFGKGKYGLELDVLSDEGVVLSMGLAVSGKEPGALIETIKPLAKDALSTIKKTFPGRDSIKTTAAPSDICSLVSYEEAARVSGSPNANEESGFREEWTNGYLGGRWGCWYLPDEAIVIVHVPKDPAAYEAQMGRATPIKGLGSKAFWKSPVRDPSFTYGQLYVVAKNGKTFGIDVDLYDADDEAHKVLATELAKIILTRV